MGTEIVYVGQGQAKDCIVGDRLMNRYSIFNGLEKPRRIDQNLDVTLLDFGIPTILNVATNAAAGDLENAKWYSYRAVWGSTKYTRPVAVLDATSNSTRGIPSTISSALSAHASSTMDVLIQGTVHPAITHVFLYRSQGNATQAGAEAGPFSYVGMATATAANISISDGLADSSQGIVVETDNNPPNAYRYAIVAESYVFAGGNYPIGTNYSVTVTGGSSTVTCNAPLFHDGIVGWTFKCKDDSSGGVDGMGTFYANYATSTTLELVDANGDSMNYDGTQSGAGNDFMVYLPGFVLRWSKKGEPESWPSTNSMNLEGDIMGIAQLPNTNILLVFTDTPSIHAFDLSLIGTNAFKTTKRIVSTEYTVSSHYSLVAVEGRLRGIDAHRRCVIETDGVSVRDITTGVVPKIWDHLDKSENNIKNWHCAFDPTTRLFGAFVTFVGAHRMIDFCIGQHTKTKNWFFNFEKDLLSTGFYVDPSSGEAMVLGGTQGNPGDGGAVWGRIWAPGVYDEWFPGGLRSGTIASSTNTVITVDNSSEDLNTDNGGLAGRWVLITDSNGEFPQLAYIESNTVNTITISSVFNSVDSAQLNPLPVNGSLFYIGLIEIRWGPKYFDFGDPDNSKKVLEVLVGMRDYNEDDLPFIRLHRGTELGYKYKRDMKQARFRLPNDGTDSSGDPTDGLYSRYKTHVEETPRWGVCIIDRSYDKTELFSFTVVFRRVGGKNERE